MKLTGAIKLAHQQRRTAKLRVVRQSHHTTSRVVKTRRADDALLGPEEVRATSGGHRPLPRHRPVCGPCWCPPGVTPRRTVLHKVHKHRRATIQSVRIRDGRLRSRRQHRPRCTRPASQGQQRRDGRSDGGRFGPVISDATFEMNFRRGHFRSACGQQLKERWSLLTASAGPDDELFQTVYEEICRGRGCENGAIGPTLSMAEVWQSLHDAASRQGDGGGVKWSRWVGHHEASL